MDRDDLATDFCGKLARIPHQSSTAAARPDMSSAQNRNAARLPVLGDVHTVVVSVARIDKRLASPFCESASYSRAFATVSTTLLAAGGTFFTFILSHFRVPSAPRVPCILRTCVYKTLPAEDS